MPDASATSCALAWSGDLTSQFEKTAKGEKVVFLQINRKATLLPVGHFTIFVGQFDNELLADGISYHNSPVWYSSSQRSLPLGKLYY